MAKNKFACRVYYEDTDAGGVVYYANYLKFAERARTEMLRAGGINQSELSADAGILFVVRAFSGDLKKPARLDDLLEVRTEITEMGGASFTMRQEVFRGPELLAELKVTIACIGRDMKPARIPESVRAKLSQA